MFSQNANFKTIICRFCIKNSKKQLLFYFIKILKTLQQMIRLIISVQFNVDIAHKWSHNLNKNYSVNKI